MHQLRLFALALQFLTRVPVPAAVGWSEAAMHASARYFPAVGALVGAWGALVAWVAMQWWPSMVAVGLSMAATVWLTGAFHEDGWADTCDGLGGAVTRDKALAIMKDSRLGTYGTCGLVFMLGLKAACLLALPPSALPAALIWMHGLSRLAPLALMRTLPYAGDAEHAKAKPLAQQLSTQSAWVAVGSVAMLAGVLSGGPWAADVSLPAAALAASLLGAALATVCMGRLLARRLGGYTGDGLGAAQQLAELSGLLAILAAQPHA